MQEDAGTTLHHHQAVIEEASTADAASIMVVPPSPPSYLEDPSNAIAMALAEAPQDRLSLLLESSSMMPCIRSIVGRAVTPPCDPSCYDAYYPRDEAEEDNDDYELQDNGNDDEYYYSSAASTTISDDCGWDGESDSETEAESEKSCQQEEDQQEEFLDHQVEDEVDLQEVAAANQQSPRHVTFDSAPHQIHVYPTALSWLLPGSEDGTTTTSSSSSHSECRHELWYNRNDIRQFRRHATILGRRLRQQQEAWLQQHSDGSDSDSDSDDDDEDLLCGSSSSSNNSRKSSYRRSCYHSQQQQQDCHQVHDDDHEEEEEETTTRGFELRSSIPRQDRKQAIMTRIVQSHRDYRFSPAALAALCQHYSKWSTTVALAQAQEDYRDVYDDNNHVNNHTVADDDERKRQLLLPPPDEDISFWSPLSSSSSSSFHRPCKSTFHKKRSLLSAFDTTRSHQKTPDQYSSGRRVRCRMF